MFCVLCIPACKKVIWKDMILPLVSMYVPVNPADRKTFLKKISNNKRSIPPGAIIGGDFNCVENITFDTLKEDGGIYQNHHGGVVTTMMRRKKLSDVFRKIHGNTARAYTRESATVRTRLDRIYAQDQNSQIVWHSHELDNEHAKRINSDHVPVIVEAAQLGEPKSRKATSKSRINTDILYEQETRREVLRILTKLKKNFKNCDRETGKFIWETFKEHAYEYLITETVTHRLTHSSHP